MLITNKLTLVGYDAEEANALNDALSELVQNYSTNVLNTQDPYEHELYRQKQRMLSRLQGKLVESAVLAEEHERMMERIRDESKKH